AADLLGRFGRRLERFGELGHACTYGRGRLLARRQQLDARDRRHRRRRNRAGRRADRSDRREAAVDMSGRGRRRLAIAAVALLGGLVVSAAAWARAALLRTSPSASVPVNTPPSQVSLTYSEAVEPRFAIVSVTDAAGRQQTAGPPHRSAQNPNELDVPLKPLAEGWYLVFWRVISADGHPVRGAFTFAVGPNPGPAPQFVIPSISETAATPGLLTARWLVFLTTMAAIGLFVFRAVIARPLRQRVAGSSLRAVTIAFAVTLLAALIELPVYLLVATAKFAL